VNSAVATDGRSIYVVWRDRRDGTWELYLSEVSDVEPTPTASPTATETVTPTPTPPVYDAYLPIVLKGN